MRKAYWDRRRLHETAVMGGVDGKPLGSCRLCLRDAKLCKSHIVPEFLYAPLYNEDRNFMGITGRGSKGWKPLNKGSFESLLCADCELMLNREYEQPFQKQFIGGSGLPSHLPANYAHTAVFDYLTFKLFHLSILFRASASSHATFREIGLAEHEERIRCMLLESDPGHDWEYPILAFAVINDRNEVERRIISQPIAARYDGHRVYGQIYGGAMWWTSVSAHKNDHFLQYGLQRSGQMTFVASSFRDIAVMHDAGAALRQVRM